MSLSCHILFICNFQGVLLTISIAPLSIFDLLRACGRGRSSLRASSRRPVAPFVMYPTRVSCSSVYRSARRSRVRPLIGRSLTRSLVGRRPSAICTDAATPLCSAFFMSSSVLTSPLVSRRRRRLPARSSPSDTRARRALLIGAPRGDALRRSCIMYEVHVEHLGVAEVRLVGRDTSSGQRAIDQSSG